MKSWMKASVCMCISLMVSFIGIGYAAVTDTLRIDGTANVQPTQYDIYITGITPESSGTITIDNYYYTIVSASVSGASQPTFTITVKNQSDKIYVYERIVEGSETGIPGIYSGNGVTYTLDGLSYLQEVAPNQELTFKVIIKADSTVYTNELLTFFKFIEKTGNEILPDGTDPDPDPDPNPNPNPNPDPDPEPDPDPDPDPDPPIIDTENNYRGLLEHLLSGKNTCLNDPNDKKEVIYSAVRAALKQSPYLLHCLTNSIPGGNMTNITTAINAELSVKMHFLIMADKNDPNVMYVYMYHMDTATSSHKGESVLTYFAVIRRDSSTSEWYEDGVYEGKATVAYLGGGGNNNKKEWMIDPSTWTAGAPD